MQYGVFHGDKRVDVGPFTSPQHAEDARQALLLGDSYTTRQLCPNHPWRPADACDETHLA